MKKQTDIDVTKAAKMTKSAKTLTYSEAKKAAKAAKEEAKAQADAGKKPPFSTKAKNLKDEESLLGFGEVIRKYRKQVGISQTELADMLGVSKMRIINWELERTQPDIAKMKMLCEELEIPANEILNVGIDKEKAKHSSREESLIELFRLLSDDGKTITEKQIYAIIEVESNRRMHELREKYFIVENQCDRPAAGSGNMFSDRSPTLQFVKRNFINYSADAIVTVDGRSMEPDYHSGDKVYIRYTDTAEPGDVVVCSTADGAVIKCVNDKMQLYSLNSDYPYAMKYEDDNVRVLGKVIGIVQPDDLPDEDLAEELDEIFGSEAIRFKREHGISD